MTHGSENWSLFRYLERKQKCSERDGEIDARNHNNLGENCKWIRGQTKVEGIINTIKFKK